MNSHQITYAIDQRTVRTASRAISAPLWAPIATLNLLMVGAIAVLVLYYVLQANAIVSNQVLIKQLGERTHALSETHMVLEEEKAQLASTELLISFARGYGMVEAANVSYVFEGNKVAYRR